jgi:anti-sigma28 factor (negative regulator of flagellin synthesis)
LYADDATLYGMDVPSKQPAVDEPIRDENRRKKIARLKKAVTEGSYHVNADQLADKLIDHMLDPKA